MTADMPDAVKVAREAVFANADACQRLAVDHTSAFTIALWGARAMQDAMAARVRVRKLEWRAEFGYALRASSPVGVYAITHYAGMEYPYKLEGVGQRSEYFAKLEFAQEAAENDQRARILSALEPAGAQEGGYDPERDLEPCLEARLFVTPESLDAFMEANPLPPEPTPAPDVPGLAQRVRDHMQFLAANASGFDLGVWSEICGDVLKAADELEALQAEVERLTEQADGEFVSAAVRVMQQYPGFDARDYEFDGISADDFEQFFSEDMREAWRCAEAAEARATAAEAERDALKAEVERMKERNAEHEARFDAESSRADHYKAEVERKDKALREAGEAIAEYFRYLNGGETRGSYDGKPEREGLRKAGYAVLAALSPAKAGG